MMKIWVYLREGIKKGVLSGAPRTPDRPSVSLPEPELHRPVEETIALQQSGANAGGVDRDALAQAIRDAGGPISQKRRFDPYEGPMRFYLKSCSRSSILVCTREVRKNLLSEGVASDGACKDNL